ncbi:MAG TPA: hypothetical protein VHP58_02065 [Alphaproteobacteria bacterium]|nr:hypothetical protein [Alphaproteobacteria bacterium]
MTVETLPQKSEDHQGLLREVKYRLSYRGTLELDTLCRRLLPKLEGLGYEKTKEIRDFLLNGENELMAWLVDGKPVPERYVEIIKLFKS